MAVGEVILPAQGTGTTQPKVAVDQIAGREYQLVKLVDGTVDNTTPVVATAPADAQAGKAALWVSGQLMVFNGTTWDRARGTIANGLLVDVSRIVAPITVAAGSVSVTSLPTFPSGDNNIGNVDVLTLPALPTGPNTIGKLGANSGVDIGDVTVNNTVGQAIPVNVVATVDGGGGGGGATALAAVAHTAAAVGTTSTLVIAANAARRYLLIENISDTNIYLKMGAAAASGQGIQIAAGGGAYEMSLPYGNLSLDAVNAIHISTGTKTLLVTEGT